MPSTVIKRWFSVIFASFLALLKLYLPSHGATEHLPGSIDTDALEAFRAGVARGVSTEIDTIMNETRALLSVVSQELVDHQRFVFNGLGRSATWV